jgi:hypothetical protein
MGRNTLILPAGLLACVREGAVAVARDVAEVIDHAQGRGGLLAARDRLSGVCALLECIDLTSRDDAAGVEVDVCEHALTLAAAVEVMSPVLQTGLAELPEDDPARLEREEEYRLLCQFEAGLRRGMAGVTATIDVDVLRLLREALYSELGGAAEDMATVSREPTRGDEWAEPVARFDRARALMDEIAWKAPKRERATTVDLATHRQAIETALQGDLDGQLDLAGRATEPAHRRETATTNAGVIERFLAALDGWPQE